MLFLSWIREQKETRHTPLNTIFPRRRSNDNPWVPIDFPLFLRSKLNTPDPREIKGPPTEFRSVLYVLWVCERVHKRVRVVIRRTNITNSGAHRMWRCYGSRNSKAFVLFVNQKIQLLLSKLILTHSFPKLSRSSWVTFLRTEVIVKS